MQIPFCFVFCRLETQHVEYKYCIQRYNIAGCSVWVHNVVSDIKG
jgi:hypothetical protein